MFNSLSSNAITAKARAIYGKRLTAADYHELLNKRSVAEVAAYLKQTPGYSEFLTEIIESQVHRGQLEAMLSRCRLSRFSSLCHYDFSPKRGFFRYAAIDIEVGLILQAVVLLNSNTPEKIINAAPSFMADYASFDFIALSHIQDFSGLLEVLKQTPYEKLLRPLAAENGKINLSRCELVLKTYYYQSLLDLIDQNYRGKVRKELREIVLIEIELINLSLIYRLKRYFKRTPEQIKTRLLPFSYKLNGRALEELLQPEGDDKNIIRSRLSVYSSKMQDVSFNYVEDYTHRLLFILTRRMLRFSPAAPIIFYSLITLLNIELENLTVLIEGIRYGHNPAEIQKILIL